jgi:hypothetical protein
MRSLRLLTLLALLSAGLLSGCQTTKKWEGIQSSKMAAATAEGIRAEAPGDYYIGRRYFKNDYKFWGYVRRPGEPWANAKLVMLNESSKLAPDRELGRLGSDNGYEYKLLGDFSGDTVYEPASNGFYPEFVLKNYELRSAAPGSIFRTAGALDPSRRIIVRPN